MSKQKECTKPAREYDAKQRAARVLSSQGHPEAWVDGLEEGDITKLAAFCTEAGELLPGVRECVQEWRAEYLEARKASDAQDELDEPTEMDEG